jgi:DNA-binding NtrC family response regulator
MDGKKILVVDDEPHFVKMMEYNLKKDGHDVYIAQNGTEAVRKVTEDMPDLVFLDLMMPGIDGIETLKQIKAIDKNVPVVMLTAHGNMDTAVEAMKLGAYDFVSKPLQPDEIRVTLKNALTNHVLLKEVLELRSQLESRYKFENIIGVSSRMQDVFGAMTKVIDSNVTVLIQGESGTGKELVARAIHYNGLRKDKPFVVVNCGAIPETLLESELFGHEKGSFTGALEKRIGKFEQADGGTIFLDEIGEMSLALQVKMLRVLQGREIERVGGRDNIKVDVRIISATNKDLLKEVAEGSFREDLYYRLAVFPIVTPPLRERAEDIPVLVEHFLKIFSERAKKSVGTVSREALEAFVLYRWPGNVRELENVIERAVLLAQGDEITIDNLPIEVRAGEEGSLREGRKSGEALSRVIMSMDEMEHRTIDDALRLAKGNISRAAKALGIGRATFYRKTKKYGIKKE